ncbi:MAG: HAD-IA family hydrolase [Arenicella sp.]|jgi:putative hydrolase of the HAD superfamily|nr:HAD-IA family hydrolase [Arenicella sp.]
MQAIQAVIFDFGGVFTSSPVEEFAKFEQAHNLPEKFLGGVIKTNHDHNAWAKFERAEMTQGEFDKAFAAETAAAGHEVSGDTLLSLLSLSLKPAMIDALASVKKAGLKTGCITNNLPNLDSKAMLGDSADADTANAIFGQFDHVIESSKAGVRKPEPRIYEMMCEALSLEPSQCVFLDDLGINLKPAKAMGMHTIKVPFGDVSPAVDELFALLKLN